MKNLLIIVLLTISFSGFSIEAPRKDFEEYYYRLGMKQLVEKAPL